MLSIILWIILGLALYIPLRLLYSKTESAIANALAGTLDHDVLHSTIIPNLPDYSPAKDCPTPKAPKATTTTSTTTSASKYDAYRDALRAKIQRTLPGIDPGYIEDATANKDDVLNIPANSPLWIDRVKLAFAAGLEEMHDTPKEILAHVLSKDDINNPLLYGNMHELMLVVAHAWKSSRKRNVNPTVFAATAALLRARGENLSKIPVYAAMVSHLMKDSSPEDIAKYLEDTAGDELAWVELKVKTGDA